MVISNKDLECVRGCTLDGLIQEVEQLKYKIRKRRILEARESGIILLSSKDLVCKSHPESEFYILCHGTARISDDEKEYMGPELTAKQFICKGYNTKDPCWSQDIVRPSGNIIKVGKSLEAYECNNCGIVLGLPNFESSTPSDRVYDRWHDTKIFCRMCDELIALDYFRRIE